MSDSRLPAPRHDDAEVRLELTNAEGRQVWALYSRPPQEAGPAETPLSIFLRDLPPLAWKWRRYVALTAIGFTPNTEQPPAVRDGILQLAALAPAVLYAAGILLFLRFQLGEREHAAIQLQLAARRQSGDGLK